MLAPEIHIQVLLLLLAPAILWAAPGVGHIFLSLQSLQRLDTLSSDRIESLGEATDYVTKVAALYGITPPALLPDELESRFATAELEAAKDPSKLVSDDRVAEAFNFLSNEFRVANPTHLTGADILQYRSVQASIFPHAFSPKSVSGSRPVGAVVMLSQLVFSGGITEGVRKAAELDRPPGSVRSGPSSGRLGINRSPNLIAREYQSSSLTYFQRLSPQETRSFLDQLAEIMALPGGR